MVWTCRMGQRREDAMKVTFRPTGGVICRNRAEVSRSAQYNLCRRFQVHAESRADQTRNRLPTIRSRIEGGYRRRSGSKRSLRRSTHERHYCYKTHHREKFPAAFGAAIVTTQGNQPHPGLSGQPVLVRCFVLADWTSVGAEQPQHEDTPVCCNQQEGSCR